MARFTAFQAGQLWAKSLGNPGTTKADLLYVLDTEAGFLCEDGTLVYLKGTGFTYITGTDGLPHLSGGKVTAVSHFDAVGHNISETTGITGTDGTGASLKSSR